MKERMKISFGATILLFKSGNIAVIGREGLIYPKLVTFASGSVDLSPQERIKHE